MQLEGARREGGGKGSLGGRERLRTGRTSRTNKHRRGGDDWGGEKMYPKVGIKENSTKKKTDKNRREKKKWGSRTEKRLSQTALNAALKEKVFMRRMGNLGKKLHHSSLCGAGQRLALVKELKRLLQK